MKVIVNKPVPPVTPPTTYDLVGLTHAEVQHIRDLVGRWPAFEPVNGSIHDALWDAGFRLR